jgi:hypothetical protein
MKPLFRCIEKLLLAQMAEKRVVDVDVIKKKRV